MLGVHISENLTWTVSTAAFVKKNNPLNLLFKEAEENEPICRVAQGLLFTAPFKASWHTVLQHGMLSADSRGKISRDSSKLIPGNYRTHLLTLDDIFRTQCHHRDWSNVKDQTQPCHQLLSLLPSGRWHRALKACTSRLKNSFFARAVTGAVRLCPNWFMTMCNHIVTLMFSNCSYALMWDSMCAIFFTDNTLGLFCACYFLFVVFIFFLLLIGDVSMCECLNDFR